PVASILGKKRLVIVADGALQYLSFAALPEPETGREKDGGTEGPRDIVKKRQRNSASKFPSVPASPRPLVSPSPLIVSHELLSLPSASSLAVLRRELAGRAPAPKTVAVIADPVFDADDARVRKSAVDITTLNNQQTTRSGDEQEVLRSAREVGASDTQQRLQRLIFSRREAEAIMSLAPGRSGFEALDFAASRATALDSNLGQYRIIH